MSFPVIYLGTIASLLTLDRFGVLHESGKSAWESFPARDTWWEFHATNSSIQLVAFSLFVLTPMMYRWRKIVKGFFSELALRAAGVETGSKKHEKFVEQAWLAVHYTLVTTLGYIVLRDKPWWPPVYSKEQGMEIGMAPLEERLKDQEDLGLQLLYATQLAFYTLELLSLLLMRERRTRSDAVVYLFHHVYTVVLLGGSWVAADHRIGSVVLICHDVGDIFLPIGKLFTYSEAHARATKSKFVFQLVQGAGIFFFVLFIITFAIPRILILGSVIYHMVYDLHWTACCGVLASGACGACPAPLLMASLAFILFLLWPMHVFWFYLIMRMAVKVVGGAYNDVRSDDEGEDVQVTKSRKID